MSALYLEAIRAMPEHLVNDSTKIIQAGDLVVAANPHHPAMFYDPGPKQWAEIPITILEEFTPCDR